MKTAMQELIDSYHLIDKFTDFDTWIANNEKRLLEKEKEQKPKWISVENNLPEKDGKYLIFDGEYEVALFKKDRFIETYPTGIDVGEYTKCHYRQELFPTHWMPLPAQPNL